MKSAEDFDYTRFIVMIAVVVCVTAGAVVGMYRMYTATVSAKFDKANVSIVHEDGF